MRTRLPADSQDKTQDVFRVHLSVVKTGLTYFYVNSHTYTPQCNKRAREEIKEVIEINV